MVNGDSASKGAVILAGGKARRMGGHDKGLLMLAGIPMVQHVLRVVLPEVQCCVINANRNRKDYQRVADAFTGSLSTERGVRVVGDTLPDYQGPLAGLSAGLTALDSDYVLMCPCDSPFLQAELVSRLFSACAENDADIAVAHDGDRLQPVFCVVNRRVGPSLDDFLDSGERKIDRWFESHCMQVVPANDQSRSFVNINTEEERLEAEQNLLHD